MSEIGKRIDAIIAQGLAPALKAEGFKKKARNFYREFDDRIEVVNVQASMANVGDRGKFTINIGAYYPSVADITDARPLKGMPKEYQCTIRERIGFIGNSETDQWWSLESAVGDQAISADVERQVKSIILPWLESMSNLDSVKTALAIQIPLVASAIALLQGNKEEAIVRKPQAQSKTLAWGKKHGLV